MPPLSSGICKRKQISISINFQWVALTWNALPSKVGITHFNSIFHFYTPANVKKSLVF